VEERIMSTNPNGYFDRDRRNVNYTTGAAGTATGGESAGYMNHPMTHYGNTAEFMVSGWPYLGQWTNNDQNTDGSDYDLTITFTHVTQHITISAITGNITVALGGGAASFIVPAGTISPRFDVKVGSMVLTVPNGATASFIAGLTNVPRSELPDMSAWSGIALNPSAT
jgi:hypothetical protein